MPDITDPQIVRFSNERCRPTADVIESMYQTCVRFQQERAALLATTIVPNTTDQIADGSHDAAANGDGRKPITGAMLYNESSIVDTVVTYFNENVTIGATTKKRIEWIQLMSVNGQARF